MSFLKDDDQFHRYTIISTFLVVFIKKDYIFAVQ